MVDPMLSNYDNLTQIITCEQPCKTWIGWCDEKVKNVTSPTDDRPIQSPGHYVQFDLENLTERIFKLESRISALIVIGIVICVLLIIILIRM